MMNLFFLLLFTTLVASSLAHDSVFDVLHYGAIGNGEVDDTQAFINTWEAACKSSSDSATMLIPSGNTFLLSPTTFEGHHCNPKQVHVMIDGNIVAPTKFHKWLCYGNNICGEWIKFNDIDGLFISGSGTIDGQGSNWWNGHICGQHDGSCKERPNAFKIAHSTNVNVTNLQFANSPNKHLIIFQSNRVYVSNIKINAPGHSPNTDGIYISRSSDVYIANSHIGTGDDCISIGPDTSNIDINNIKCGPGHGISIGSIGKYGKRETVERVTVQNVEFRGTQNGVRIKTWQGGNGYVKDVLFQNIKSHGSRNPIIIDQYYCDHTLCKNQKTAVQISNVRYNNVFGTSAKETAVTLRCSETVPCTDISLSNINIPSTTNRRNRRTNSYCQNAHGSSIGQVIPVVKCLD